MSVNESLCFNYSLLYSYTLTEECFSPFKVVHSVLTANLFWGCVGGAPSKSIRMK